MDGREIEAARENFHQFLAVVGDAAARAAEREAGTDEHREAELVGVVEAVAEIVDERRTRNIEADADHCIFKEQTIFGFFDGFQLGADQLDVVAFKNAGISQVDGEVKGGLAADGG